MASLMQTPRFFAETPLVKTRCGARDTRFAGSRAFTTGTGPAQRFANAPIIRNRRADRHCAIGPRGEKEIQREVRAACSDFSAGRGPHEPGAWPDARLLSQAVQAGSLRGDRRLRLDAISPAHRRRP